MGVKINSADFDRYILPEEIGQRKRVKKLVGFS